MKFVHYFFAAKFVFAFFAFRLEITNFLIDKSPPLCYNGLAFGRIFFVHRLGTANYRQEKGA